MALSSSSSVSHDLCWKYDVFVSFRRIDTGKSFVSHLLRAFDQKSISTFVDAEEINRGDLTSVTVLEAVKQSRLSIVVFSENYASSRCCLDQLVQILECGHRMSHPLVPVFYGVDSSDVRRATGCFGEAFEKYDHQMNEAAHRWRAALTEATGSVGWDIKEYRNEAEPIKEIVQHVFDKLIHFSWSARLGKYDVFLNFRGEDTRKSFVSHLYKALSQKVINTYMDDEGLGKGNSLSELLKSIKESRVSIVVFSENYCSSSWCLKELVQILKCMDEQNQIVVPVFYEVDPSEVCKPEAFPKAEMEEVQSWTSALTRATNLTLPGWDSRNYE
ncbi:hypothetical protein DVH24_022641 [Malus domestica]|uniref:TIR domain-containing protein n=1 Tax=Malus domestica TaxID=3750 RepID=A0A498KLX9_MALDO|nr:hypothetical protein DVH24_022641 [Malus domestica]